MENIFTKVAKSATQEFEILTDSIAFIVKIYLYAKGITKPSE